MENLIRLSSVCVTQAITRRFVSDIRFPCYSSDDLEQKANELVADMQDIVISLDPMSTTFENRNYSHLTSITLSNASDAIEGKYGVEISVQWECAPITDPVLLGRIASDVNASLAEFAIWEDWHQKKKASDRLKMGGDNIGKI